LVIPAKGVSIMRKHLAAALAASLFFSGAAVTFAAQGSKAAPHKEHAASEKTAKGVVKSIDDSSLVLQSGKNEMKFTVNSMTNKTGIAAGAHAVVHYKMDGKNMVATSVMADAATTAKKK